MHTWVLLHFLSKRVRNKGNVYDTTSNIVRVALVATLFLSSPTG